MHEDINSYFGNGIKMEGTLRFKGALRFDGDFEGSIETDGTLIVGNQGKLSANIKTGNLHNMGSINGDIIAKGQLAIYPGSRLTGNIDTPAFLSQAGAIFQGSCTMPDKAEVDAVAAAAENSMPAALSSGFEPSMQKLSKKRRQTGSKIFSGTMAAGFLLLVIIGAGFWFYNWSLISIRSNVASRFIYTSSINGNADKMREMADVWINEGNFERAAGILQDILAISDVGDTGKLLAYALINSGKEEQATVQYQTYLTANPMDEESFNSLKKIYNDSGDVAGLIRLYELTLDGHADRGRAWELYKLYRKSGSTEKALQFFQSWLLPKKPTAKQLLTVATMQVELGRVMAAAATYKKLTRMDKRNVGVHLRLGYLYHKAGLEQKGAAEFRLVAKLDESNVESLNNAGFLRLTQGSTEKAIEQFNLALDREKNNLRAFHGLATSYSKMGQPDKVIYYCKKILSIDANYSPAHNRIAWTYAVDSGKLDEAERHSLASMKYNELPDYMDTLSEVYYRKGEYGKAIAMIEKAMKLKKNSAWFRSQLKKFRAAAKR